MGKRQAKKRFARMRAELHNQPLLIHPPALDHYDALLEMGMREGRISRADVAAVLGLNQDMPSRTQMVNGLAIVPLVGVLRPKVDGFVRFLGGTAMNVFEQDILRAESDPQVKGTVIYADSPGGSAIGCEEAAQVVYKLRGGKPKVTFVRGMCASACYYIGSAAPRIIASPSSPVGSIGTILVHAEFSKWFEELGVTHKVITHGKHKGDGNQYEPLGKQGEDTLRGYVEGFGNQFDAAAARHRGVSVAEVRERFGQGKIFMPEEAQKLGMIDGIGTIEDAMGQLLEDARSAGGNNRVTFRPGWSPGEQAAYELGAEHRLRDDIMTYGLDAEVATHSMAGGVEGSMPDLTANHQTEPRKQADTLPEKETSSMNKKIKAALYALDMTESVDASDEVCQAALNAFFVARNESTPNGEGADEKILAALSGRDRKPEQGASQDAGDQDNGKASNTNAPAPAVDADKVAQEAVTAERERVANIQASGQLLEMSAEDVTKAIASNKSHSEVIESWHKQKVDSGEGRSISTDTLTMGEASIDKFNNAACEALLHRVGMQSDPGATPPEGFAELRQAPLSYIASETLRLAGQKVPLHASGEQIGLAFLQMGASGVQVFGEGPSFNRPGDFPNLLSNLVGKVLAKGFELSNPSFPEYCDRLSDLPDFKPRTVVGVGHFDELDLVMDDEEAKERNLDEELASWIQSDRFANKVALTPVMIANDDLDAFVKGLRSLAMAHDNTLNRLCLALVTGNVTLLDGTALFHADHGNLVSGGGAPSAAQATKHKKLHRQQSGIGGKGKVRTPPAIALVPSELEDAAEQTFLSVAALNQAIAAIPNTDTNINVHRGKIKPVVEPELDDVSTSAWYTFADPNILPVIVYAYMKGYGRGGRRSTWFEPGKETRYWKLEGRFAAAPAGHRGGVRNPGS